MGKPSTLIKEEGSWALEETHHVQGKGSTSARAGGSAGHGQDGWQLWPWAQTLPPPRAGSLSGGAERSHSPTAPPSRGLSPWGPRCQRACRGLLRSLEAGYGASHLSQHGPTRDAKPCRLLQLNGKQAQVTQLGSGCRDSTQVQPTACCAFHSRGQAPGAPPSGGVHQALSPAPSLPSTGALPRMNPPRLPAADTIKPKFPGLAPLALVICPFHASRTPLLPCNHLLRQPGPDAPYLQAFLDAPSSMRSAFTISVFNHSTKSNSTPACPMRSSQNPSSHPLLELLHTLLGLSSQFTWCHTPIFSFISGLCCCAWAFSTSGEWGQLSGGLSLRGFSLRGSLVAEHWLSRPGAQAHCSGARGVFPDQGSNLCPLPWQGHS